MKLLLMAHDWVGHNIASYLLDTYPEDLALVVTTQKNEIYSLVEEMGYPAFIFESSEQISSICSKDIDLGILAWWPNIIDKSLLAIPRNGYVNTHPSLLPYNRGKHYNFWAIVEEVPFGVTLHRVDPGVDTGDIIVQKEIPYDWTDTGETLYFKARNAILDLFIQTYPILRSCTFPSRSQKGKKGSYHHSSEMDQASQIHLDMSYKGKELLNLLRARTFCGHPGCWFEDKGHRYEISVNIRKVK